MFGNRRGKSDAEGMANSIAGLKKIAPLAEEQGVTICVELLNSKVDHKDYQGDHTPWAVEVMKGVGSSRMKLLYDIYHMQIMEGDVIRTIRDNIQYIAHFHTGGVPGRHELDGTQELNYNAIAKAIADTGFTRLRRPRVCADPGSDDEPEGGVSGLHRLIQIGRPFRPVLARMAPCSGGPERAAPFVAPDKRAAPFGAGLHFRVLIHSASAVPVLRTPGFSSRSGCSALRGYLVGHPSCALTIQLYSFLFGTSAIKERAGTPR